MLLNVHKTQDSPDNRELSDPNIMPRSRNSADSEISNWISGPMKLIVLQEKLIDEQGNFADATGEVIGVSILSSLEDGSAMSPFMGL